GLGVWPVALTPYAPVRPERTPEPEPRQSIATEVGPVNVQWISSVACAAGARSSAARKTNRAFVAKGPPGIAAVVQGARGERAGQRIVQLHPGLWAGRKRSPRGHASSVRPEGPVKT